jgi:hypothetical protein
MSEDISHILRHWEYDPEDTVRIIKADDGRQVMQVRQPLGIEQYELDGRPDGKRPHGKSTFLEVMIERSQEYINEHDTDEAFAIEKEEMQQLQNEGVIMYYRYLHLFQLGDYKRTVRDTEHNLKLCDFIESYAEDFDEAKDTLQYRPYIIRMNAISNAMISLHNNLKQISKQVIEDAIAKIKDMPEIDTPAFQFEKVRSLNYLRVALKQVLEKNLDPVEKLKKELQEAIEAEEYERAAQIRDKLREYTDEEE